MTNKVKEDRTKNKEDKEPQKVEAGLEVGAVLSSFYLSILQQIQSLVQGLDLTFNSNPVQVIIKKISRWTPDIGLPSLPVIFIVGEDRPESVTPWSTEDEVLVKYMASIVSIAASNADNTANLDIWLRWREQERRLFQWGAKTLSLPNAFFSEFVGDPAILKEAFLKNYDVSGFGFRIWNVEQRTN